jgi:hypothetical protein
MRERDDTRDRFLAAIAEKLNPDAVAEAHLFQPLKQGGTESGVAVIAVDEPPAAPAESREPRAESREPPSRLAVYTAKYRLTLKGPDRGKWEFAVQVDADAPLVTVDKVVRGVQRRSGDAEDPERLTGEEFRALLPPPPRETAQGQSA